MSAKIKKISGNDGKPGSDSILKTIEVGYNLSDAYLTAKVGKATVRDEVPTVLKLEQLTGSRFSDFYVDTDAVREADTLSSLERLLQDPLEPYTKLLFSGFTGSGKTTELLKLCFKLKDDFNVIIFSAWNRLKIDTVTFESLLFEIIEDVLLFLFSNKLVDEDNKILKEIVDKITEWCSSVQITTENLEDKTKTVGKGLELIKGFFFKAKTETRSSGTEKETASRIEERKIKDLIFECNKIFDYLREKTGKETLIIIDDLEKIPFLKAREFYVGNSSFIREFYCKMVLTIPVELVYHSDYAVIQNVFGEAEVLPMIKIKDKDGNRFREGWECLEKILEKRVELSLFEKDCYKDAIRYSGGAIRELFRIIQRAAVIEKTAEITCQSMEKSVNWHKNTFASRIQERDDEIKIKFEEYLDILIDIYEGNKKTPTKNRALSDLLRTRAVMSYNGEGFYDTHPLLGTFIEGYIEKRKKAPGKREK